jgi:hypothetical protein
MAQLFQVMNLGERLIVPSEKALASFLNGLLRMEKSVSNEGRSGRQIMLGVAQVLGRP